MTWTNPTDNGGKATDGWAVYYCASKHSNCSTTNPLGTGGGIWTRVTGTGSSPADILSGTTTPCKYWIHMSVKNAAGYGWLSDIANTIGTSVPT